LPQGSLCFSTVSERVELKSGERPETGWVDAADFCLAKEDWSKLDAPLMMVNGRRLGERRLAEVLRGFDGN